MSGEIDNMRKHHYSDIELLIVLREHCPGYCYGYGKLPLKLEYINSWMREKQQSITSNKIAKAFVLSVGSALMFIGSLTFNKSDGGVLDIITICLPFAIIVLVYNYWAKPDNDTLMQLNLLLNLPLDKDDRQRLCDILEADAEKHEPCRQLDVIIRDIEYCE